MISRSKVNSEGLPTGAYIVVAVRYHKEAQPLGADLAPRGLQDKS